MSPKKNNLTAPAAPPLIGRTLGQTLRNIDRELFLRDLHADLFCRVKRPHGHSLRAVVSDGDLEFIGDDEAALRAAVDLMGRPGGYTVSSTKLQRFSEDELLAKLSPDSRGLPRALLGPGAASEPLSKADGAAGVRPGPIGVAGSKLGKRKDDLP